MTVVRMLADDLTGAVDSICSFALPGAPISVIWSADTVPAMTGSFAVDTETRRMSEHEATGIVTELLPSLTEADIAVKKLASLLRGHAASEIATCFEIGRYSSAVIAPAFPAQGRVTRGGRQFVRPCANSGWQELPCDLTAELGALGHAVRQADGADAIVGSGIFVCDAESEADLDRIVAAGRELKPPILWCGSAGLTRALAGVRPIAPDLTSASPALVIVGSAHPKSAAQVDALLDSQPRIRIFADLNSSDLCAEAIDALADRLDRGQTAVLTFQVAESTRRADVSQMMSEFLAVAVEQLPRPGSIVVVGGDTLFRFASGSGADRLSVRGELMPGVPVSELTGGRWHGLTVISKSGAFGETNALCMLLDRFVDVDHAVT